MEHKLDPLEFAIWLKGFLEIASPSVLNINHINKIKERLSEVFVKVTPDYDHSTCKNIPTYGLDPHSMQSPFETESYPQTKPTNPVFCMTCSSGQTETSMNEFDNDNFLKTIPVFVCPSNNINTISFYDPKNKEKIDLI